MLYESTWRDALCRHAAVKTQTLTTVDQEVAQQHVGETLQHKHAPWYEMPGTLFFFAHSFTHVVSHTL